MKADLLVFKEREAMLLEEFEDMGSGYWANWEKPVHDKGERYETIILSFNGEILEQFGWVRGSPSGGYLKA